ncbi:MAG: glycosyltransferase [Candidatus Krumholzibacteria bacterium]|nr:glycosyltransferase [Candidatus Krumholzibacteria bacterium]
MFRDVTIIIKTFERPAALRRLLSSVRKYYGNERIRILVADDSRETFDAGPDSGFDVTIYKMPFDSGVSAGRNLLLGKVSTKYFLTLDDDFVFGRKTRIENLLRALKDHDEIDLAAGLICDLPRHWWQGKKMRRAGRTVTISDGVLKRSRTPLGRIGEFGIFNHLQQFFVAKTDKIRKVGWNDHLKTVEHTAFFLDCARNGIVSVEVPSVIVYHQREKNKFYGRYRNARSGEFVDYLHRTYGYNREIETD